MCDVLLLTRATHALIAHLALSLSLSLPLLSAARLLIIISQQAADRASL